MIAFLAPFLEDLRGLLELNCDIGGSTQALQMMGSAYMRDGYAKLNGLLHPFENLRMEVLFSEENIILTDFYTQLTTGTVTADGRVALHGWRNFPTQIMAKARDISLEIPEDVQTRGDAQIEITGSWFPFLFKGNYDVKKARVTMEFDGDTENASVRYTSLLPESLIQTNRSVIQWDVVTSFQSDAFISNSLIDSHFYGDLRLLGVLDHPVFLGEIHFAKNGIFKFRDTPFRITTASVRFPNQEEFDPVVSLIASTQVKEYDINLLIQGSQNDHTIQFESNPSLPEDGIISLIALGFISEQEEDPFSSQEGQLGNAFKYTGLEKVLKDTTGVEVNVSSTAESEDFENVPRVTLKKQWGSQLSTSLSRRLGSGLNTEVTNTDPVREFPKSDVKIEYQLDDHFSIVGMWEDRETHFLDRSGNQGGDTSNMENKNILGLDLKYELEF